MSDPRYDSLLESIPPPDVVRGLIQRSIRHTAMLRQVLKLAERKHQYADHDGSSAGTRGQEVSSVS